MKKLLEVLKSEDGNIRFGTELDMTKNPQEILEITSAAMIAMVTSLWGGNERTVLAVIRALAIADLAVSVNIEEMCRQMKENAYLLRRCMDDTRCEFERKGG